MRYALALPNGGPWADPRTLAELARLAEDAGYDGVFLEDYIIWQSRQEVPSYDPWISLAAIALRTERVRLGTMVTPLARRRPWKVAAEATTLDHLSHGRLVLGVGLGDTGESVGGDLSFTHFGEAADPRVRARMLDEALAVLVGLWSGQPFRYDGEHYHVKELTLLPPPLQRPRIPIWVGGGWPLKGPAERAARWDGSVLYRHKTHHMQPDDLRALKALVASRRGSAEGYEIVVGGSARRADWDAERATIYALAEAGATWWCEYVPPDTGGLDDVRAAIARGPLRID